MKQFNSILQFVKTIWLVFYTVSYIALILTIGFIAFTQIDQATDVIFSIFNNGHPIDQFIVYASIILWALVTWYTARVILYIAPFDSNLDIRLARFCIAWLPRILGLIPFGIIMCAIWHTVGGHLLYKQLIVLSFLEIIYILIVYFRIPFLKRFFKIHVSPLNNFNAFSKKDALKVILKDQDTKWAVLIFSTVFITLFLLSLLPVTVSNARCVKPIFIVSTGLCFLTFILSIVMFFNDNKKKPVLIFGLSYIIFCSFWNDNSKIRELDNGKNQVPQSKELNLTFNQWKNERFKDTKDTVPLIIIAAEGGGIRGMYWTAKILQELNYKSPAFFKHVFAISGVSGGGIGAIFYSSFYKDSLENKVPNVNQRRLDDILGKDYLSDLTNAFVFTDNIQKLFPFRIPYLCRSNRLEDAFSLGYSKITQTATLDSSFFQLWHNHATEIPNLFLNGVLAETGQKIIESNIALPANYFRDVVDYNERCKKDIALKTVALFTCRFPFITNGGLIIGANSKGIGHITDGGYKDNTGLETAISLLNALSDSIKKNNKEPSAKKIIKPYIIFIKNSDTTINPKDDKPYASLHEIKTVTGSFFNAYNRNNISFENMVAETLKKYRLSENLTDTIEYIKIELDRDGKCKHLPLGWYLSDSSKTYIIQQAENFFVHCKDEQLKLKLKRLITYF